MDKKANIRMITLTQAQNIRSFIRNLEDVHFHRGNMPDRFLADQEEDVRVASWNAAMDMAESMARDSLRKLGVDA